MTGTIDFDAIREANPLPAVVGRSVELIRAGNEYKALCPFHREKTPSFTIFAGGLRFYCHGCGATGDVVDYVRLAEGVGYREAAERLDAGLIPKCRDIDALPPTRPKATISSAERIWRNAVEAAGSPVEAYLKGRAITIPLPSSLRFSRLAYPRAQYVEAGWAVPDPLPVLPCMIALVQDADGNPTGIQRTFLDEFGEGESVAGMKKANVPKPKLGLGSIIGGAVRLGPVQSEMLVSGGIEDGLSLSQLLGPPALAVTGEAMMSRLILPDGVRSIGIAADNDDAGRMAVLGAEKPKPRKGAAEAFKDQGRAVSIYWPPDGAKDWNQHLTNNQRVAA
ncbi:CHC2 zinc finger domain-containing protein [uncultured Parasphingopyxis sp.]|uniref:DUF7146 domain-containing protein n=1 Tax=uncultured Parasphingopyxis sp. TaxID=1547918 RepID=UPI002609E8D7|nr:CHC2 zinc finger domain-containing protein [uncultured Parasphingopyxis sp.]